jgi:ABC-type methionine transport system ATPase subunit
MIRGDLDSNNADHVMKILVKMNRDRRMTMVMVTHDMALKNFADRVVWMRDGKIARIERIAADKRQNVHQELTARLAATANNNSNSSGELAGGDLLASNICRTEYRQPACYPALRKQTAAAAQSTQPCLHSNSQTLQSTLSNMKTLAESSPVQQRNYSTNATTLFDNQNDRIILATHEMSP